MHPILMAALTADVHRVAAGTAEQDRQARLAQHPVRFGTESSVPRPHQ